jgi:hypothetical protein
VCGGRGGGEAAEAQGKKGFKNAEVGIHFVLFSFLKQSYCTFEHSVFTSESLPVVPFLLGVCVKHM